MSRIHENSQQAHQLPTGFQSPTKPHRQLANPIRTNYTNDPTNNRKERYQNQDSVAFPQPIGSTPYVQEPLLSSLVKTIEKIGTSHDFPAIEIVIFDGSPQNFPVFRQRFEQMVQSKPFDEPTKMSRLLQLLKGAALNAVKRYETLSDGLSQAMKLLEDRFGRPCQIVRACVDTLTKGPMIAPNDKQGLRKYADDAQVMYDALNSMGCLGEMNADNLDKMIL